MSHRPRALRALLRPTLRPLLRLCLLCASGCASLPGFDKPRIHVEPRVAWEEVTGTLAMQSPSPVGPVNNPALGSKDSFNFSRREIQIGGRVHFGDTHSGLTGEIMQQDFESKPGQLLGDFGNLMGPTTSLVDSDLSGMRMSLAYHAVFWTVDESEQIRIRFAAGASVEHEQMDFSAVRQDGTGRQDISARDTGFPMVRGRVDIEVDDFGTRFDIGYSNGDWGDIAGPMYDLEVSLRYQVNEGIALIGGYRWLDLPFEGYEGPLKYELDLQTSGYFVAARLRF